MAVGIKVMYSIRNSVSEKTRITLLNALVLSHLHYSIILLIGIQSSLILTLNKQLNWALKACFYRRKSDRVTDLRLLYKIFPVEFMMKYRAIKYLLRLLNNDLPGLSELKLPTFKIKKKIAEQIS